MVDKHEEFSEFVAENLPEILTKAPDLPTYNLKSLGFEVRDFSEIREHPKAIKVMFDEGLFELTTKNLEYAYKDLLGGNQPDLMKKKNYSTIRQMGNSVLL